MLRRTHHLLFLLFLAPQLAEAAVTVNEVAWMGDTVSANHEWIELYNSGEAAVSLDGWTLSDGMNLSIPLTGTIGPGDFAVLERTSEESAPGAAFLMYTGALVNTGATLTLKDASGTTVDQVPGGTDWQDIGGDNTTKETAQYTAGGWVTAPGTPGKSNATIGSTQSNTPATSRPKPSSRSVLWRTDDAVAPTLNRARSSGLVTSIEGPAFVYENEPVMFTVTASGVGDTIAASLVHQWSFGDTYAATGTTVTHRYTYPGTYLVSVESAFAKHRSVVRQEVVVLPITISLGRTEAGDILLHNDAPYEVDLTGYVIRGTKELTIPSGTVLLPRGTVTIASTRVEAEPESSLVAVYDTRGTLVTSTWSPTETLVVAPEADEGREIPLAYTPEVAPPTRPAPAPLVLAATAYEETEASIIATSAAPETEQAGTTETAPVWPYVGLIGVIGLGLFGLLRTPKEATGEPTTGS